MASFTKFAFSVLAAAMLSVSEASGQESIFNQIKQINTVVTNDVTYTSPMIIFGKTDGKIVRCLFENPGSCEVYHEANSSVTATVVHGEFLFASLASGVMLRCQWHKTHSCFVFHQADSKITGLAVATGFIHAGLQNGIILRCEINTPHSCQTFFNLGKSVMSLANFGSVLYVGSAGQMHRCFQNNCSKICSITSSYSTDVIGLGAIGNKMYGLIQGGYVIYAKGDDVMCGLYVVPSIGYSGMAIYNRKLYLLKNTYEIDVSNPLVRDYPNFNKHDLAQSISFAYGTYAMQNRYQLESKKCIWKGIFKCPPTVFYYDVQNRFTLEVSVKDGALYDSQGALVDTADADESHSQKAAIFAMGPDGQILLSNVHKKGLLHTSSLLAGHPVSGAGLMVVEKGKIINMTACSVHYRPDQELNKQVIESLYLKGYTDTINSEPCAYRDILCWAEKKFESEIY